MQQPDLFTVIDPPGYSPTSRIAYNSNKSEKINQAERILKLIKEKGETTLLELSELIGLPQSTISGRICDLQKENKVQYMGRLIYKEVSRKRIVTINH